MAQGTRDNKGRFKKGHSGNAGGRPKRADELRLLLDGGANEVAEKVLESAKGGDLQAARLVLERCVPITKATLPPVQFDLDTESPSKAARDILKAIANGTIPPDIGKALMESCMAMARVDEIDEMKERITRLEEKRNASGS